MKIGLDARQLSHRKKHGLRTYVENLVKALSRIDNKNDYFVYLDAKDPYNLDCLGSNFKIRILPWKIKYVSTLLNDHLFLPARLIKDKIDIMHYPANPVNFWAGKNTVITVVDALPFFGRKMSIFKKGIFNVFVSSYQSELIRICAKKAASILTISKKSMEDLEKFADLHPDKIIVIHNAANENFKIIENKKEIESNPFIFLKKYYQKY